LKKVQEVTKKNLSYSRISLNFANLKSANMERIGEGALKKGFGSRMVLSWGTEGGGAGGWESEEENKS